MPSVASIAHDLSARQFTAPPEFGYTRHDGIGGTVRLVIYGELDLATTAKLERVLSDAQPRIVLDLRALSFIDCSCLSVLVSASDQARVAGGRLRILSGAPVVDRLFNLTEIRDRLEVVC